MSVTGASLGQYVPQRAEQDGGTGHKNENEKEQATFAGWKPHRVKRRDVVVEKGGEEHPHGKQNEQDRGSNEKNGTGGFGHLWSLIQERVGSLCELVLLSTRGATRTRTNAQLVRLFVCTVGHESLCWGVWRRGEGFTLRRRPCSNPQSIYKETFWVFKGVCWLEVQKRPEKNFKIFHHSFY